MNATLSWILLLYFISVAPFDVLRYLIGPYGTAFCEFHQFMRISIWVGGYLVLGVVISLRYIFIFRYDRKHKNLLHEANEALYVSNLQVFISKQSEKIGFFQTL